MGTTDTAIAAINTALDEQERNYMWLSRKSGVPYKRLLAELKNRTRPISLETAIAVGNAIGVDLPRMLAAETSQSVAS